MRFAIAVSALLLATPAFADQCLKYDQKVTLTGVYGDVEFPGPPNYENVAKGDAKEGAALLFLQGGWPCTEANDEYAGATAIPVVQLVCDEKDLRKFAKHPGVPVTVTGTLMHAETMHHRTPVMLVCN